MGLLTGFFIGGLPLLDPYVPLPCGIVFTPYKKNIFFAYVVQLIIYIP
jgi:hypothetical protein